MGILVLVSLPPLSSSSAEPEPEPLLPAVIACRFVQRAGWTNSAPGQVQHSMPYGYLPHARSQESVKGAKHHQTHQQ